MGRNGLVSRRNMPGLNPASWDAVSILVMEAGVEQQMQGNIAFKRLLMSTGDAEIVEANPYDTFWGIGLTMAQAQSVPRASWGCNNHGKVLERQRNLDDDEHYSQRMTTGATQAGSSNLNMRPSPIAHPSLQSYWRLIALGVALRCECR